MSAKVITVKFRQNSLHRACNHKNASVPGNTVLLSVYTFYLLCWNSKYVQILFYTLQILGRHYNISFTIVRFKLGFCLYLNR